MKDPLSPELSVIIPCFEEENRLPRTLEDLLGVLEEEGFPYEVLIVDDGSGDGTVGVAETYVDRYPGRIQVLSLPENRGKGAAVRIGMLAGRGEKRLFLDADGSVPFREYSKLTELIHSGADLVIGSRVAPGEAILETLPRRRFVGWCFRLCLRLCGLNLAQDTQCGFKMFRGPCAVQIFERVTSPGFGFDIEALYIAQRLGYRMEERRVEWHHRVGSKVRIFSDSFRILRDALAAKFRHRNLGPETLRAVEKE